jgi:hypothetical protein
MLAKGSKVQFASKDYEYIGTVTKSVSYLKPIKGVLHKVEIKTVEGTTYRFFYRVGTQNSIWYDSNGLAATLYPMAR